MMRDMAPAPSRLKVGIMAIPARSILAVAVIMLFASPLMAAQDAALDHGSLRETWPWWLGLTVLVAVFAWAAIASSRWDSDRGRQFEEQLLKSMYARGDIDQRDYDSLSHELDEQARDRDEQNRER